MKAYFIGDSIQNDPSSYASLFRPVGVDVNVGGYDAGQDLTLLLSRERPGAGDISIIQTGTNDLLRSQSKLAWRQNYEAIIRHCGRGLIVLVELPALQGRQAGVDELNGIIRGFGFRTAPLWHGLKATDLPDGIHPTAVQHAVALTRLKQILAR